MTESTILKGLGQEPRKIEDRRNHRIKEQVHDNIGLFPISN